MKHSLSLVLMILVALGSAGCATFARKSGPAAAARPRAFALAVTVNGVLLPTPRQWAVIQAKVAENLADHGWVVVTDLALADNILRIDFTPNPNDPENSGHARILNIRNNPRIATASTTSIGRYPTSFGYLGSFQNASWGFGGFSNNPYYGWGSSYYDGYSYGSANLNPTNAPIAPAPRPTLPPHRPNPGRHEDCPSPWDIRQRPAGPHDGFASRGRGDSWTPPPSSERARWRGGDDGQAQASTAFARSGDTSSRPERTNWRTDPSGARAERTSSRPEPSLSRLERSQSRNSGGDSPRSERTYSRSEPSESRRDPSYSRSETSRSWHNRSESSASRSESSSSRPERSYSRGDSSGSGAERSYSRSESSYSRSDSHHSRSDSSHSRSDSSRSYSRDSGASSSAASSPPPAPAQVEAPAAPANTEAR